MKEFKVLVEDDWWLRQLVAQSALADREDINATLNEVIEGGIEVEALHEEDLGAQNEHLCGIANDFENGAWRYDKLVRFLMDNLVDTALSAEEKEALTTNAYTMMQRAISRLKSLRNKSDGKYNSGGEIGEIMLYGIMSRYYHALPVVPKIFNKQNNNVPAYGADSVHILVEKDKNGKECDFSVWLGESKFYKNVDEAIEDAISSLDQHIEKDALKKENSIIIGGGNIKNYVRNETLQKSITDFLDLDINSTDEYVKKLHIPILIMYECKITRESKKYSNEYIENVRCKMRSHAEKYFAKQKSRLEAAFDKYDCVNFHLILFPFPEKEKILSEIDKVLQVGVDDNNILKNKRN